MKKLSVIVLLLVSSLVSCSAPKATDYFGKSRVELQRGYGAPDKITTFSGRGTILIFTNGTIVITDSTDHVTDVYESHPLK